MMKILRQYSWSIIVVVLGVVFLFWFNTWYNQISADRDRVELEMVHEVAIQNFESSIHEFAAVVSGMRSFMNLSSDMPSQEVFQKFVSIQMEDLGQKDSLVVSFIDTGHAFLYSFTPKKLDPVKLVGRSVKALRNRREIKRLSDLMKVDHLVLFEPINLLEGWLGIPLNFRVRRNDTTLGYVAPIINFRTIIQPVYDDPSSEGYAFRFESAEGFDFDREQIYNGSSVYNTNTDEAYYKNFSLSKGDFMYSTIQLYGSAFRIGTAKIREEDAPFNPIWFVYATVFMIAAFVINMNWQMIRLKSLNGKLASANRTLENQKLTIEDQNVELMRIAKARNQFFSIIGHDLKEPLNSIEGLMGLIVRREFKDPKTASMVKRMAEAARNTKSLINNLLRWSLSQSENLRFAKNRIQINELLIDAVSDVQAQADSKKITVDIQSSDTLLFYGDSMMISTLVRNLISNAIKFTQRMGKVKVKAWTTAEHLYIEVADNGRGMDEERQKGLFDLTETNRRNLTAIERDSGLGLALSMDFAKKHGGTIEVKSEKGVGSEFRVILPLETPK